MAQDNVKYKRVVLKLSGEAMAGEKGFGINPETIKGMVQEIKEVHALGVEVAIVVGVSGVSGSSGFGAGVDASALTYKRSPGWMRLPVIPFQALS